MSLLRPRPQRWDHPLDAGLDAADLAPVLALAPWAEMAAERPDTVRRILRHDARLRRPRPGELVVREGDHGNTAFFVVSGSVRVVLEPGGALLPHEEGKREVRKKSLFQTLAQRFRRHREPEVREDGGTHGVDTGAAEPIPIVLGDWGAVLADRRTARMGPGALFGEISALGRTARTATVVATGEDTCLLEIRWQGLRDLRRGFPGFKAAMDEGFRARALHQTLAAAPTLANVGCTDEVHGLLREQYHDALFLDVLDYEPLTGVVHELALGDATVRVEGFAQSPAARTGERVRVFRVPRQPGTASLETAACATLMAALHRVVPGRLVLLHEGAAGARPRWQWLLVPVADDAEIAVACQDADGADTQGVARRLVRALVIEELARQAEFRGFGSFEAVGGAKDEEEAVIAEEGTHPNGLLLIRAGHARVTRTIHGAEQTLSYLGPSLAYGLEEIAAGAREGAAPVPLRHGLRALGYVDVVMIPTAAVEQWVLPALPARPDAPPAKADPEDPLDALRLAEGLAPGLVPFLVDHRLGNGRQAMLIDLERCTRCDDCVRACASAHDANPRFVRHGPVFDGLMVVNACMHCADPTCMIGCPTGAIHREADTGLVVINDQTCIGCATCARGCPYDAIRMVETRTPEGHLRLDEHGRPHQKATKCDLCIDERGGPACVSACSHDALGRVDLGDLANLVRWVSR